MQDEEVPIHRRPLGSGDNAWLCDLYAVRQLIVSEAGRSDQLQDKSGVKLDKNETPQAGSFRFHLGSLCSVFADQSKYRKLTFSYINPPSDITFSSGLEYFSRFKVPNPEDSFSTWSDSRRSSITQERFDILLSLKIATIRMCMVIKPSV
nr:hypothetical protein L204_06015 [Cryptococcus depauperatus CBS 7855]